jgi:hypothetical protein
LNEWLIDHTTCPECHCSLVSDESSGSSSDEANNPESDNEESENRPTSDTESNEEAEDAN